MTRSLQVEDVKELIRQVGSGATDPLSVMRQILRALGDDASMSGDVLRQVIVESGLPARQEVVDIVNALVLITKIGEHVKIHFNAEVETVAVGTSVRLGPEITCALQQFPDGMALADILGVAVNKFMWLDIQRVQFRDTAGRRTVRVDTNFGAQEFALG